MKNFRNSQLFKRVVPLTLAAVVLAGTVLGIFGTIFAYAEGSIDGEPIRTQQVRISDITFYTEYDETGDMSDNHKGEMDSPVANNDYDVILKLEVIDQLKIKINSIMDSDAHTTFTPFKSVTLIPGDYTKRVNVFDFSHQWGPEEMGGRIYYYYLLKNVRAVKFNKDKQATMEVTVAYKDKDEYGFGVGQDTIESKYTFSGVNTSGWDEDDDGDYGKTTNTTSSETEVLTTPKMIITGFDIPAVVNPGEEFQVTVEFLNNSKKKDMENVSMTLTPSEGVAIKNGVNKRHYIKIPRRQSTSETFTLKTSKELAAEALSLTVKFDYQYEVDNAYKDGTSEEILYISSIPKEKEEEKDEGTEGSISSFEILSVVPPDQMFANEDGYVTVKVINKDHQYDASNVQLTIVGDGLVNSGNTEYHGALAHSSQAEIEMAIQFAEAGTYNLQAIVTYEDSVGKDKDGKPKVRINDLVKDFTLTVEAPPEMGGGDMMGMGGMGVPGMEGELDENGMPVSGEGMEAPWYKNPVLLGCIGGGAVVLIIIVVVIVRKVRKKRADDDEDI